MSPALNPEYENLRKGSDPDAKYWAETAGPNPYNPYKAILNDKSEVISAHLDFSQFRYPPLDDHDDRPYVLKTLVNPSLTFVQRLNSPTWNEKRFQNRYKEVWRVRWTKENDAKDETIDAVLKMVRSRKFICAYTYDLID